MPAEGYTWKDIKALNIKIREDYQNYTLEDIRSALNNSFSETQKIITKHTNKELFEKKQYKWTGSSSLSTYIRSNSSSHYKEFIVLMRSSWNTAFSLVRP